MHIHTYTCTHTQRHNMDYQNSARISFCWKQVPRVSLIWHTLIGWTNKCMIIGAMFLGISGWYSKNTIIWNEKDLDLNPGWILLNVWHNLLTGCVRTKKHKIKRLHMWYLKGSTKLRLHMLKHLILAHSWNAHKKFSLFLLHPYILPF